MDLMNSLAQAGGIDAISRELGVDQATAQNGLHALLPAVTDGMSSTGIRSFYAASSEKWLIRASSIKGAPANILDTPIDSGYSATQTGQYKGR